MAIALVFAVAAPSSVATPSGAFLVVHITGFTGPDCSAATFTVTNVGTADQPFGWTLTLSVPNLGLSETFFGQQPLLVGETRESIIGTGITAAGIYHVTISPGHVAGHAQPGSATLKLPATC